MKNSNHQRERLLTRKGLAVSPSFVYCLWDGTALKFGKSIKPPLSRLKQLQTGNPRPIQIVAFTKSMSEELCHHKLQSEWLFHEWYKVSAKCVELIANWEWRNDKVYNELIAKLSAER